jgi:hypothetical protein
MNRRGHAGGGLLVVALGVLFSLPILWPMAAVQALGGGERLCYVATGAWCIVVLAAQGWAVRAWGWGSAIPLAVYLAGLVVFILIGRMIP